MRALIFLAIAFVNVSFAAEFHVRPTNECNTSGDGTAATCAAFDGGAGAFNGFSAIDWLALQPGDTLYVIGRHTNVLTVGKSGTPGQRIVIRGDKPGAQRGIIDGGGTLSLCFTDSNNRYLSVLNLEVARCLNRGLQFDNGRQADVAPLGGAIINNVYVHDIDGGTTFPTCIWGYGHEAVVENSRIENCGDDGIWWTGDGVRMRNNSIAGVGIGPVETGDCIQLAGTSKQFDISRNRCDHMLANEKHCIVVSPPDGTVFDWSFGGRIEENTCFMPRYNGVDTKGISTGSPNVLIARNFVTGARVGINAADPYIVANVVTQFYDVGIQANGHAGWQTIVANNTAVSITGENQQAAPGYCLFAYDTTGEYVNNIVSGCKVGMGGFGNNPSNVWDSNLSWRNTTVYQFGKPAQNTTINTLLLDPFFVGSDPRGARSWSVARSIPGKDLSGYVEPNFGAPFLFDFLKNPRPMPPAVGAYEPDSK